MYVCYKRNIFVVSLILRCTMRMTDIRQTCCVFNPSSLLCVFEATGFVGVGLTA